MDRRPCRGLKADGLVIVVLNYSMWRSQSHREGVGGVAVYKFSKTGLRESSWRMAHGSIPLEMMEAVANDQWSAGLYKR